MHTTKSLFVAFAIGLSPLGGCKWGDNSSADPPPQTADASPSLKPNGPAGPEATELRCLPQLKAMIAWYGASQSAEDTVHHFQFVRGVRPGGGGYFVVDFSEANRYLGFLRQSGFFSEKYLAAERQAFQESQETFAHLKQTDGEPNGFVLDRLFGVMVVQDMMHFTRAWKFKPGAGKNTIVFDTGESARAITFGADCKIEAMESVPNDPQNPDDFTN